MQVAEWSNAAAWKAAEPKGSEGSNPFLSTEKLSNESFSPYWGLHNIFNKKFFFYFFFPEFPEPSLGFGSLLPQPCSIRRIF